MKYGEVCNAALQLMNQYSLAGDNIPTTYNNQADYYRRMAELVDDAQMVIAAGPRRIRAASTGTFRISADRTPTLMFARPRLDSSGMSWQRSARRTMRERSGS